MVEKRYDAYGEIREMNRVDGYVMIRRPRCSPFVKSVKEWDGMSVEPIPSGSGSDRPIIDSNGQSDWDSAETIISDTPAPTNDSDVKPDEPQNPSNNSVSGTGGDMDGE